MADVRKPSDKSKKDWEEENHILYGDDEGGETRQPSGQMVSESIFEAANRGDVQAFQKIFDEGADLRKTIRFFSANCVHLACKSDQVEILQLIVDLLRLEPEIIAEIFEKRNHESMTPAMVACRRGSTRAVLFLIELGVEGAINLESSVTNTIDIYGKTSMDWAAAKRSYDTVQVLLAVAFLSILKSCRGHQCAIFKNEITGFIVRARKMLDGDETGSYFSIDEVFVSKFVNALLSDGENVLYMLLDAKQLFRRSKLFKSYEDLVNIHVLGILNSTTNRSKARTLLTPMHTEKTSDSLDIIARSVELDDTDLLCHDRVQEALFDKWDPNVDMEHFTKASSLFAVSIWSILLILYFSLVFPLLIILRPWIPWVFEYAQRDVFLQNGGKFQIPINRWFLSNFTYLIYVILYTYLVFHLDFSIPVTSLEWVLLFWSCSVCLFEMKSVTKKGFIPLVSSFWRLCDCGSAALMLAFLGYRIAGLNMSTIGDIDRLLNSTTCLAFGSVMLYLRLLSLFELSPTLGPILQSLVRIITFELPTFITLAGVLIIGFTAGVWAMFQNICLSNGICQNFDEGWVFNWKSDPTALFLYLVDIVVGISPGTSGFDQKFFGISFLTIYAILAITVLLNIFIAMLSATFSYIREGSNRNYKCSMARIIVSYGNEEAMWPPFSLLDDLSRGLHAPIDLFSSLSTSLPPLKKERKEPTQEPRLFQWSFPEGAEKERAMRVRSALYSNYMQETFKDS